MNKTYVIVAGFFASGSSAVVDLLREFKGYYECRAEIRTIKDPYGIKQLEHSLVEDWDVITSTAAVSDFLEYSKKWSRSGGGRNILARAGLNYQKTINPRYMELTMDFVDGLTSYRYNGDFYHFKFKKSYAKYVIDRIRWVIEHYSKGKIKAINRSKNCYFSRPTKQEFELATKTYFDNLFEPFFASGEYDHIILDQAISPNDAALANRYFTNSKMIIIDRDPRDMFADDLENVMSIDSKRSSMEHAKYYIDKQKAMRGKIPFDDPNVLYIHFEDLVLQYEKESKRVMDFLGLTDDMHIKKREFLNPDVSCKNVGIWKRHYDECPEVMNLIKQELPELCYGE